ncbi:mucin-binding protein, partial [Lactobacillus paragasseri]|uniref:mucin-binding protein n=1 Tax=Lactobacillus paragasseri TaxID=2107999 RepID=UPI003B959806
SFDKDNVSTYELPAFEVSQVTGYDSYVNGSKAIQVGSVDVNADSQNVIDTITYVKQDSTPVPYKPGKEGVNDEMNKYVTRTIIVKEPGKPESRELQVVHFTNEDKNGNSGYKDPVTGEVTYNSDWHVAGNLEAKTGTWAEFNAPEVTGYTANPEKVAEETVTSDTKDTSVTITYTKNSDTPVPFDPSNENMYKEITRTIIINMPDQGSQTKLQTVKFTREDKNHNAGYTDPVTGKTTLNAWHIVNGVATTGTWTEFNAPQVEGYTPTPDTVSAETVTPETKDVSVIISYSRNDIPETPTDADKYTPEGQDVHTTPGVVPPAE